MDFTNGYYKAENPVVLEELKTFLQSMERRGATVKDLDDAIVQLNNVSHSISTNALVKADVLDKLPENPFRSMLNEMLQSKGQLKLNVALNHRYCDFGLPRCKVMDAQKTFDSQEVVKMVLTIQTERCIIISNEHPHLPIGRICHNERTGKSKD